MAPFLMVFVSFAAICPAFAIGTTSNTTLGNAKQPQVINDASGQAFMEEITPTKPASKAPKRQLDLSNVGVQVDPSGKIIPLINKHEGILKPFYSRLQAYDEPAWNFLPPTVINPSGQVLNIYGQPIDAFGNPINQYGQPLNTWARLGVPFLGTTPPPLAPYVPFYGGSYPYWNTGTNLNFRIGRNLGPFAAPLLP